MIKKDIMTVTSPQNTMTLKTKTIEKTLRMMMPMRKARKSSMKKVRMRYETKMVKAKTFRERKVAFIKNQKAHQKCQLPVQITMRNVYS